MNCSSQHNIVWTDTVSGNLKFEWYYYKTKYTSGNWTNKTDAPALAQTPFNTSSSENKIIFKLWTIHFIGHFSGWKSWKILYRLQKILDTGYHKMFIVPVIRNCLNNSRIDDSKTIGQTLESFHSIFISKVISSKYNSNIVTPVDSKCASQNIDGSITLHIKTRTKSNIVLKKL